MVANHHERVTERVRHVTRGNQEPFPTIREHGQCVLAQVIELPHFHILFLAVVDALLVSPLVGEPTPRRRSAISSRCTIILLIVLHFLQGTAHALCNPLNIKHRGGIRIYEDIKRRHPFSERAVARDHRVRLNIVSILLRRILFRSFPFVRVGRSDRVVGFFVAVTALQPAVTRDKKILDGTTKLFLHLKVPPPIVDDCFGDDRTRGILGATGVYRDLRVVDSNAWFNNIDRTERCVNQQAIFVGKILIVLTTIQVDHAPPSVVVEVVTPPFLGLRNLLAILLQHVRLGLSCHQASFVGV